MVTKTILLVIFYVNLDDPHMHSRHPKKTCEELESQEDEELVLMLVDMVSIVLMQLEILNTINLCSLVKSNIILMQVCDKSEALAHQRLATRMLANKTKELERRLQVTSGGQSDEVFTEQKEAVSNG